MCAIFGALVFKLSVDNNRRKANELMNQIIRASHERGRDGRGYVINWKRQLTSLIDVKRSNQDEVWNDHPIFHDEMDCGTIIGNVRAEPTTEYVEHKSLIDQQPYQASDWIVVHNGTIANDKELRTGKIPTPIDSAAIPELLDRMGDGDEFSVFCSAVRKLKGSYAILAMHSHYPNEIHVAANYRPVWYVVTDYGVFFASSKDYFPEELTPVMMEPYSAMTWDHEFSLGQTKESLRRESHNKKALVVCSGGLDSVVAATYAKKVLGYDIELLHFQYGSRAEAPEVHAVQAAALALGAACTLFPLPVYKPSDSPLLQAAGAVAGGEEGAEFAHEWVPARNLLLLSVATAYAEANGFEVIVLGNNLEEAGAYPDNEPEFIRRFNDMLPFAVGDGKRMEVIMPVGNLMKHEIVELGLLIGAPMDKTWSCYRAGEKHCGKCGPCFMRRKAFEINGKAEVIEYEDGK